MKPKLIRITANRPIGSQSSVELIIGDELTVQRSDSETGEVWVNSRFFGGIICLNADEYEVVQ